MYNPWNNFYNTGSTYSYLEYVEAQKTAEEDKLKEDSEGETFN